MGLMLLVELLRWLMLEVVRQKLLVEALQRTVRER